MNTANKLTMTRVVMIPIFLAVLYLATPPYNQYIALAIFILALSHIHISEPTRP